MKFIRSFSSIYAPIVETIKREHQLFELIEVVERGFRLLKYKIIEYPILAFPIF